MPARAKLLAQSTKYRGNQYHRAAVHLDCPSPAVPSKHTYMYVLLGLSSLRPASTHSLTSPPPPLGSVKPSKPPPLPTFDRRPSSRLASSIGGQEKAK